MEITQKCPIAGYWSELLSYNFLVLISCLYFFKCLRSISSTSIQQIFFMESVSNIYDGKTQLSMVLNDSSVKWQRVRNYHKRWCLCDNIKHSAYCWPFQSRIYLLLFCSEYIVVIWCIIRKQRDQQWAQLALENCEDEIHPGSGTHFFTFTLNAEASVFLQYGMIKINTLITFWYIFAA